MLLTPLDSMPTCGTPAHLTLSLPLSGGGADRSQELEQEVAEAYESTKHSS